MSEQIIVKTFQDKYFNGYLINMGDVWVYQRSEPTGGSNRQLDRQEETIIKLCEHILKGE